MSKVVASAIQLIGHNGMEVCGQQIDLGHRISIGAISVALNRYPYSDSMVARYLAPVLRRVLDPPGTPAWYFRLMEEYRQSKRRRPVLYPRGTPGLMRHAPSAGYGWNALEAWALTAYLISRELPRPGSRQSGYFPPDREKLKDLVYHACGRIRLLLKSPPLEGPGVMEFSELCAPLRRRLLWNASHPRAPVESRRFCRDLLSHLQRAMIPRLPPRDPVNVWYDHRTAYRRTVKYVRGVWKETKDDGNENGRKNILEQNVTGLHPSHGESNPTWGKRVERFWRRCGDLRTAKAHIVAARILDLSYRLDLEPQRLRELLSKVDETPPYHQQWLRVTRNPPETLVPVPPPLFL